MKGIEGTMLGRYELRRRIAQGGTSEVYLGYDRRVKRRVAVKVLYGSDEPFVRRFEREALAVGALSHDHILPLYDFGEQRPWYYLVMPYVEGGTLRDYLFKRERLSLEEASSFLEQIAAALQYAHDHGVVHRDVKPSNILLRPDGYAYLGDFGLAKAKMEADSLTHAGTMVGTPEYMAPEQSNGQYDYRSDIYSLGIILYQMLTGRVPFIADTPVAISLKHIQIQPTPPSQLNRAITPSIEAVIFKALAKNPNDRYQQAMILSAAYKKALREEKARVQGEELLSTSGEECDHKGERPYDIKLASLVETPVRTGATPIPPQPEPAPLLFPLTTEPSPLPTGSFWRRRIRPILLVLLCLLLLGTALPFTLLRLPAPDSSKEKIEQSTPTTDTRLRETTTAQAHIQATLAAQAHVEATAGITSAIGAGKILYTNDMTSSVGGWLNDGHQCFFSPEGYHVSTMAHTAAWCYYNQRAFSNAVITTQAQLLRGDIYGLVFRLSPASKAFYVLELNSQSEYRLVRAQGNDPFRWLVLIDWTYSGSIVSGYGRTNTFLVITAGRQFTFYINKQLIVSSFLDVAYHIGLIGFLAGGDSRGGTEAVFSRLWVFQK